jgi:protein SCO1/2
MSQYFRFTKVTLLLVGLPLMLLRAETPRYSRSVESYSVPAVMLVDAAGKTLPWPSVLDGSPLFLQFVFTSCTTICPLMSSGFASLQDKLGSDAGRVRMVSISIDPEHDTPARLREYAAHVKAGPQWQFFTGRDADIVALQQAFHVYQSSKTQHLPVTFFRASPRVPWIRLDGLLSASELLTEYHRGIGR